MIQDGDTVQIARHEFHRHVQPDAGTLTSLVYDGREMLAPAADGPVGPVLQVWRAPTDNDKGFGNWLARDWREAGLVESRPPRGCVRCQPAGPGEVRVDVVATGTVTGGQFCSSDQLDGAR